MSKNIRRARIRRTRLGLRDLPLKSAYDSDEDDVLNDFYIPVLSETIRYRRLAGFFSSTALAVAARGIHNFILRGGEMELITSAYLSKQDVEAIRAGLQQADQAITSSALYELNNITEDFVKNNLKALAWLIASRKLRIKIAIPLDDGGHPLDRDAIETRGIFHQKVGLLVDESGDMISFSGSINETAYAWMNNIEEFKVFRSWDQTQYSYFISDHSKLDKYWMGNPKSTRIIDIPTAVRERLLSMAPARMEDLLPDKKETVASDTVTLRDYQKEAIERWHQNNFKGILSMATGTGKTITALNAIKEYVPTTTLNIIAVPTILLAIQWKDAIRRIFPDSLVLECDSTSPNWESKLKVIADHLNTALPGPKRFFTIIIQRTAGTERFGNIIGTLSAEKLCLVGDEVHHMGAPVSSNILSKDFSFRLGLSATPERFWDEEGQSRIDHFFDRVVYDYPIIKALKDKVLCEYMYYVKPAILEDRELLQYSDTTVAISGKITRLRRLYPSLGGLAFPRLLAELGRIDPDEFSSLQALLITRVNILKRAHNKIEATREIVENGGLKRCLIYCNDIEHVHEVRDMLGSLNISAFEYDSSMKDEDKRSNLSSFAGDSGGFLVAVKCLDEGADIPSCDSAILISSSKNSREFIQRRGRMLRQSENKDFARIHDIIVLPIDPNSSSRSLSEIEYSIIESELDRARLFAESAKNSSEVLLDIARIESSLSAKVKRGDE